MWWTLTLEKLYDHIFFTPDQPRSVSEPLRDDQVLWLNHHNLEGLPDALEYYLVNPNNNLEADLYNPGLLDQSGMKITIKTNVYMPLLYLLDWTKCFLATYGAYPCIYNLLDTSKHVLFELHELLCDSMFPRPLLPQSRGPPMLQNEPVAVKPNLASSTPSFHHVTCPSVTPTVQHVTHLSVTPSMHNVTSPSIAPSIHDATHPSITLSVLHGTCLSKSCQAKKSSHVHLSPQQSNM